ncbi:hypothetical protein CFC21_009739 [Triticum aestivum]|uniref:Rx N-terminal domain-containing protein n=2 Tax=Triticum aestivum TaxID=4565 RepID=A0A9R1DIY8_WHEAT|nr:hypothetical protein CFC21_009739 [Triticum aestivum]
MAETAIAAVLSKLGEFATKEARLLLQVGDDIMLLRDRLEWLQAFIRDADRKRRIGADDLTRVWVRQTRDVAFEAEDALDDFFHKVDVANQNRRGWKILGYLSSFRTQITVRHGLSARINRIKSRLDQISENQKEYKIDHSPSGLWTSSTTALAPDGLTNVVEREKDVKTVHRLLFHEGHLQIMFISILGESGVGKGTLTTEICELMRGRKEFLVVRYSIPPGSSIEYLLEEVYKRAYKHIHNQDEAPWVNGNDIADKLRGLLTGTRYLLVLKGISSKTILNCVRASLPADDKTGSRVVLILEPECEEVARHANTLNEARYKIESTHRLSHLDEDASRELFRWRVFGKMEKHNKDNTKKTTYEKKVFDLTKGYPLAIVVLAGLLRHKEEPVEWDAVLQELSPGMEEAEDGQDNPITGLLLLKEKPDEWKALQQQMTAARETKLSNRMVLERILSASFDDLPQDLKSCFLYLAAYPMNVYLSSGHIVRMWTAEGFIKPRKGMTLEELGHSYLKELVSRCLVRLIDKNAHGGIKTVIVHSRLVRFLQSEAREASFIEIHDRNEILAPASVRRLSVQDDSGNYATSSNKFPKLRSFICRVAAGNSQSSDESDDSKKERREFPCGPRLACVISSPATEGVEGGSSLKSHDLKFLRGSKFLRLMSVQGLRLQALPDEIGDMIHLRYLRVECPGLKKLPRSIRRLLNLQTLDISKTAVVEIDAEFWKIKTLRHVLAEKLNLPTPPKKEIEVIELPDLQTLHGVVAGVENWVKGSSLLDKMSKLQSLELHGFNAEKHGSALKGAIRKMHFLGHMKLVGDKIPSCLFTEPNLRCLQAVDIKGTVEWANVTWDVLRKVRPNLVELKLNATGNVPKELINEIVAHKLICIVDGKFQCAKRSKDKMEEHMLIPPSK